MTSNFRSWPTLRTDGIFEDRLQRVERGAGIESAVEAQAGSRERHVPRLIFRGRERQPDDPGAHRGRRVRQHAEREPSGPSQLAGERGDPFQRLDDRVVLADRLRRWRVFHHQRAEAEPREQLEAALLRRAAVPHRLGIELDRAVDVDAREGTALTRVCGVILQPFALALVRDLGGVRQQGLEVAVLRDQFARPLLADARNAFDVVDGVAHQGEHVDDLPGRHAELLVHRRGVEPGPLFLRVVDLDAVVHQLKEILVSRDDRHLEPGRGGLRRQRADHVVRFIALRGEDGHAHGFARLVHQRDLLREIAGHRRAVGLVVGDDVVAEGRAGEIEGGGDVLRLMIVDQLAQHRHEAIDGVGGVSVGAGQPADRVIGAIHLRAAVDQVQSRRRHSEGNFSISFA
jgi:hypothetical protein